MRPDASGLLASAGSGLLLDLVLGGWSATRTGADEVQTLLRSWATALPARDAAAMTALAPEGSEVRVQLDPWPAVHWLFRHRRQSLLGALLTHAGTRVLRMMAGEAMTMTEAAQRLSVSAERGGVPASRHGVVATLAQEASDLAVEVFAAGGRSKDTVADVAEYVMTDGGHASGISPARAMAYRSAGVGAGEALAFEQTPVTLRGPGAASGDSRDAVAAPDTATLAMMAALLSAAEHAEEAAG